MAAMSSSILDALTRSLGPAAFAKAGATYGESDPAVSKGFTIAVASVLAPLVARAGDAVFTRSLLEMIKDVPADVTLARRPRSALQPAGPGGRGNGPDCGAAVARLQRQHGDDRDRDRERVGCQAIDSSDALFRGLADGARPPEPARRARRSRRGRARGTARGGADAVGRSAAGEPGCAAVDRRAIPRAPAHARQPAWARPRSRGASRAGHHPVHG